MKKQPWTPQEDKIIIKYYQDTPMYELIQKFPGRTSSSIRSRAHKLGQSHESKSDKISLSKTKPSHLDTFFENSNNINASFIAGLIASDGNVYFDNKSNYPRIAIKLKEGDKNYLEGIRNFLKVKNELYFVKRGESIIQGRKVNVQNQYALNIYSVKTAVKHLEENFNIVPKKTLTLQPPNTTDLRAKIAYTVGYIDGDGSIYTSSGVVKGKRYYYNKLSIYGQKPILEWMQKEVFGVLNPQTKNIKIRQNKKTGLHSLTLSESSLTTYLNEVDKLGLPKMERKWSILSRREQHGKRHANKNGQISTAKITLQEITQALHVEHQKGAIINNELYADVYFPNQKIAIVINDESIPNLHNRNVSYGRKQSFNDLGIRLIQYWSGSIIEKPTLIKSMIKNALGVAGNKLYARKCEVKNIDSKTYRVFLNENHIEGAKNSGVRLGLFFNGVLVSVMGFSNYAEHYELDRFCSVQDTVVVGGFSKLFKNRPKNKNIVSYSFNTYSEGNVYSVNGFEFSRVNKNSLYYFHDGVLKNRNGFMKYKLAEKLNIDNSMVYTEKELASMIGAHQVFDAGTKTWVFKNN